MKDVKHAAQVVLINKEGLVLHVSRKDDHKSWGLVGGKVDPEDESFEAAAIRETKEETGIDIHNLVEVFSMYKDGYMGHTYLAEYTGEINFDPIKEPHLVEWKPFAHAMRGSFGKWNTMVLESLNNLGVELVVKDPKELNLSERLGLGVKKYGYDSEFMKEYQSIIAQLRHSDLVEFFDKWDVPRVKD